ncbi:co-chaperone GroES [Tissierella sp.]|uniref:co-chaperone GroES n=1 Tax=Tissierella sp. TaxID=41274 RepID=UPI00285DC68E|nr:co-chaperone GroES [Tissierella sp.]MDR7856843.1 co-chaperone GroES [Tissierella sp.]
MNLKPLGDRVVIKKVEVEEKTKSGIVLPSSAKEQPQMAEVVAIGADITNDEKKNDQIKVGDKIIFSKYAGTEIKVDGDELTILKLADILAVVE